MIKLCVIFHFLIIFRNALNNKYKTKVCSTCFFSSFKVLFMHYRSSTTFFNTELLKANIFCTESLRLHISIHLTIFKRLFTLPNYDIAKVVYFSYVKIWVTLNTHFMMYLEMKDPAYGWTLQTSQLYKPVWSDWFDNSRHPAKNT